MNEPAFPELPVYCAKGSRGVRVTGRVIGREDGGRDLQLCLREGEEGDGIVAEGAVPSGLRFFVALEGEATAEREGGGSPGSIVVPYGIHRHGSTIYLPFQAGELFWFDACDREEKEIGICQQKWTGWRWGEIVSRSAPRLAEAILPGSLGEITLPVASAEDFRKSSGSGRRFVVYAKLMQENDGWGALLMASGRGVAVALERQGGIGDFHIPSSLAVSLDDRGEGGEERASRIVEVFPQQQRVYQLFPRLFNNLQSDPVPNGTLARNGCGKWEEIAPAALQSLHAMGFTAIWLTGILQHGTGTAHPECGLPADPPDLLKGIAGSPYAVKNPFDLSPDGAVEPEHRLKEFRALVGRIHDAGMEVFIDCIPNHIARCFLTHPLKGKPGIGAGDDHSSFFSPHNYFYYLQQGAEGGLRLPTVDAQGEPTTVTCRVLGGCTGRFERERDFVRVSGNNIASPAPSVHDWYETVKLNYGFNFVTGEGCYPGASSEGEAIPPALPIPPVWRLMDSVLAHWQEQGVDGFRCDMAHMIPPEFWMWAIARARRRAARAGRSVTFLAEAYDDDPMRVPSRNPLLHSLYEGRGNVGVNLIDAGFDLVYDGTIYKKLKEIYDGAAWANDLDASLVASPLLATHSLRYAENHDEVRLASAGNWGDVGMNVGRPVCAILYGAMAGGVLLYNGQEVGESAGDGIAGYGGGQGRTTIFDYWSMPELRKWVNGGRYDGEGLSVDQRALRECYGRLLSLVSRPAFRHGLFLPLNGANQQSRRFGRLPGEAASGHWMYAFLRYDQTGGELFLVVVNLHAGEAFRNVEVVVPGEVLALVGLAPGEVVRLEDRLSSKPPLVLRSSSALIEIPVVPPLTPYYFEVKKE